MRFLLHSFLFVGLLVVVGCEDKADVVTGEKDEIAEYEAMLDEMQAETAADAEDAGQ